jgi:hypothetical protein
MAAALTRHLSFHLSPTCVSGIADQGKELQVATREKVPLGLRQ